MSPLVHGVLRGDVLPLCRRGSILMKTGPLGSPGPSWSPQGTGDVYPGPRGPQWVPDLPSDPLEERPAGRGRTSKSCLVLGSMSPYNSLRPSTSSPSCTSKNGSRVTRLTVLRSEV